MSIGLFDDAGINPEELKVTRLDKGTYPGIIDEMTTKNSAAGDPYIVIAYKLDVWEWPLQDWFRILPPGKKISDCDDTDKSYHSFQNRKGETVQQTEKEFFLNAYKQLKRRLMDLGVPEDAVNRVQPGDLKGRPVLVSVDKNANSDFPRITGVSVPKSSGTSLPKAPVMPGTAPVMVAPVVPATAPVMPMQTTTAPVPVAASTLPAGNPFGNI